MTFQCRFKEMGLAKCADTFGRACEPCRTLSQRLPLQEHIAKIERDVLDSMPMPRWLLSGWNVSGTALEAEERRQQRDDHAEALQYALAGRRGGKTAAMREFVAEQRAQGKDVVVIHGHDRGMPIYDFPCSCGRTIRGTDRDRGKRCEHEISCPGCGSTVAFTANDCLAHHYIGKPPCAWNGRQRAVVEQEQRRMREASGIWCSANGTWACSRTDSHIRAMCHDGRANGIPKWISDAHPSPFRPVHPTEPKTPTLREWLGDRVSGLGPWADVLREQPVPAGWIERWEWEHRPRDGSDWILWAYDTKGGRLGCRPDGFGRGLNTPDGPFGEALQMALFTRHPDVKPAPRLTIGCEDQYEV